MLRASRLLRDTGTVRAWMENGRFGFVRDDATGKDLYVHHSDLVCDHSRAIVFLKPDERVRYEVANNPARGPDQRKCVKVTQIDGTPFGMASNTPLELNIRGASGVVCFMKIGSSYGFVSTDGDPNSKIFFHARDVIGAEPLYQNERVTFDVVPDKYKQGKPRAISIRKVRGAGFGFTQ